VRLANLDATAEGCNVNVFCEEICEVNPLFYHQIDRSSGISSADINIYFDEIADGSWDGIANNETVIFRWEEISGSSVVTGAPLSKAFKASWDNFIDDPYALCRNITPVTFNDLGPFCVGDVAVILPSTSLEGISGTWSPATINTSSLGTIDYVFTPDAGQTCFDTYTMSVDVIVCCNITLTVTASDAPCFGDNGQIVFSSVGGQAPVYYTVNGTYALSPYSGPAGDYVILVTDASSCTASVNIVIGQPQVLQVNVITTPAQCGIAGGSALASFSGGTFPYSFLWSNSLTGNQLVDLDPGTYSVEITDDNGCTASDNGNIGILGSINAVINLIQSISCPNEIDAVIEAVSSNAENPVSYLWNIGETSPILSNIGSGDYIVNITDNWGCVGISSIILSDPPSMQIEASITPIRCNGENNGSINLSVTGGIVPYIYTWSNLFDDNNNVGLYGGEYFVTIYDGNSCSVTETYNVIEPDELVLESQISNISCYGYTDGAVSLTANGGVEPYEFAIFGNDQEGSGSDFYGLPVGSYRLQVQDQNDCYDSVQIIFSEPAQINATYNFQGPSCIGNNDGYIEVFANGGTAPYLYNWNQNSIDIPLISGLLQGIYNISIVDANDCVYELEAVSIDDVNEDCIRIPNAFSPNGDGVNDTWIIEHLDMFPSAYVYAFNRWGQLIYTGRPGDEWDGRYNNHLVPTTSYIYVVNLYNGTKPYEGLVTVIY
jgi:gliding motility-associated-like protein